MVVDNVPEYLVRLVVSCSGESCFVTKQGKEVLASSGVG